ncbi:ZIP family metal transporter [Candidatus Bathyarchaeota archaeon]|nr:ZIP family metal transporter [Candidatus Bathyarchaeota archaeon]
MIIEAFLLSLIAGSATVMGGIFVCCLRKVSDRFVSGSMGFASGVMLLVAFLDLLIESMDLTSYLNVTLAFAAGSVIIMIIDLFLPHMELGKREDGVLSSDRPQRRFQYRGKERDDLYVNSKLRQSGLLILIGITLHNIPEGLIVSAGYSHMPQLGVLIAISIFFHNLPEGIATAIPLISAGSKKKDVVLATFLSGMAEPFGALIGGTLLVSASTEMIGLALAFAGGVMTYITVDELIPVAHEYGHKHSVSAGILLGIIFMMLLNILLRS